MQITLRLIIILFVGVYLLVNFLENRTEGDSGIEEVTQSLKEETLTRVVDPAPALQFPVHGSIFVDPDIITDNDRTTFKSIKYIGKKKRVLFDRRIDGFDTVNAFVHLATFDDNLKTEVRVNPEFIDTSRAGREAEKYAIVFGRLPKALRKDIQTITIHQGEQLFGGGASMC